MFLVTFFHQTYARGRGKNKMSKEKTTHWLSVPDHLTDKWHTYTTVAHCVEHIHSFLFFLILFLFSNDDKRLPVATVRKFDFSPYLTFIRGQRTFLTLFNRSILRTHSSSRNRSLNVKLRRVLDFKSNTHPGFIKASLQYSQQSLFLAISTGGMVAFGSAWPDSLAEDCHLIIARRHWTVWEIPRSRYTHVTGRRRMSALVLHAVSRDFDMGKSWSYIWLNAGLTTKVRV